MVGKKYYCDICKFQGCNSQSLYQHKKSKKHINALILIGDNKSTDPCNSVKNKKNTHICIYCDRNYSNNSHLIRHLKTCKIKKEQEQTACIDNKNLDMIMYKV